MDNFRPGPGLRESSVWIENFMRSIGIDFLQAKGPPPMETTQLWATSAHGVSQGNLWNRLHRNCPGFKPRAPPHGQNDETGHFGHLGSSSGNWELSTTTAQRVNEENLRGKRWPHPPYSASLQNHVYHTDCLACPGQFQAFIFHFTCFQDLANKTV